MVSCGRSHAASGGGWSVDLQLLVGLLGVEADRLDGGDHHHHAEGDRDEQHDDVFGSILQSQLLVVRVHLLVRTAATLAHGSRTRPPARPRLHQKRATFGIREQETRQATKDIHTIAVKDNRVKVMLGNAVSL